MMTLGLGFLLVMRASMMGICPTGGHVNNILRYEDLDTGGMYAKLSVSGGDVIDTALDEKGRVGVLEPPDIEGDAVNISDLQTTADEVVSGHVEHVGDPQPVHARRGTACVQAPHDVGGGVATADIVPSIIAQDVHEDAHVLAPTDEGGGADQVLPVYLGDVQHSDRGGCDDRVPHGGEEADTAHTHGGAVHVQAPHDEGGGESEL